MMINNSIEALKQELITQKNIIEKRGGVVPMANTYPSPSEITEGIKTVTGGDLTVATATEADVLKGKTFFSGNSILKTGTAEFDADVIHHIFMSPENTKTTEDTVYYTCPSGVSRIKKYTFYNNINPIHIIFDDDLVTIEEYAFYGTRNMSFENVENLMNLKTINGYAFSNSSVRGIDFSNLPTSLTSIYANSFYNAYNEGMLDIKFGSSITTLGNSAFKQDTRRDLNSLDISELKLSSLPDYLFFRISFNCDLVFSSSVTEIGDYFNCGGSFRNITIPPNVATLRPYCFGSSSGDSNSVYFLETVTFERESPPTIAANVFAPQHKNNNFKIYVPDNSIEEYKALTNMSTLVNYIFPVSEKE